MKVDHYFDDLILRGTFAPDFSLTAPKSNRMKTEDAQRNEDERMKRSGFKMDGVSKNATRWVKGTI